MTRADNARATMAQLAAIVNRLAADQKGIGR